MLGRLMRTQLRRLFTSPVDSSGSHPDFHPASKSAPIPDYQQHIQSVSPIQLVHTHKVLLFMKGTPDSPQCGFSQYAIDVLRFYAISQFHSVNVLEDAKMREEVKKFSNWQTYPQLYVDKELVGGCDILAEMHKSDQLREFFAKHNCK